MKYVCDQEHLKEQESRPGSQNLQCIASYKPPHCSIYREILQVENLSWEGMSEYHQIGNLYEQRWGS